MLFERWRQHYNTIRPHSALGYRPPAPPGVAAPCVRFAVAPDRVTHFALGANDQAPQFGSMVLYVFTNQPIASLLPAARSWIHPPAISAISGCTTSGYQKDTREFTLFATQPIIAAGIEASARSPVTNPCLAVKNWGHTGLATVKVSGAEAKEVRQGTIMDRDGTKTLIIWIDLTATAPVEMSIGGAIPHPTYKLPE